MTGTFDDEGVSTPQSLDDMVAMAMARRALRPLVPNQPPMPSPELMEMLATGVSVPTQTSRRSRLLGRLAGVGIAGKLMLATGVALAGGAATAVAWTHEPAPPPSHDRDVTGSSPGETPGPSAPAVAATSTTAPGTVVAPDGHDSARPSSSEDAARRHDGENHDGSGSRTEDGTTSHDGSGSDISGSSDSSGGSDSSSSSGTSGDSGTSSRDGGSGDSTDNTTPAPTATPTASGSPDGSGDGGSGSDGGSGGSDSTSSTSSPSSDH